LSFLGVGKGSRVTLSSASTESLKKPMEKYDGHSCGLHTPKIKKKKSRASPADMEDKRSKCR